MTGICVGVTERGSFKKKSEAMHNPFFKGCATHSEFTMHMHNQLKAGSLVATKPVLSHGVQIFSYARAMK